MMMLSHPLMHSSRIHDNKRLRAELPSHRKRTSVSRVLQPKKGAGRGGVGVCEKGKYLTVAEKFVASHL